MSLRVPDPPYASVAALHNSLKALAERGQFGARPQRKARGEQLSATLPHQVFVLGLADAADGAIDRAKPTGWRYLLEADEEVVASGETRLEADGGHTFAQINQGPFVRGTVRALAAAEEAANTHEHEVEFAVLHVPALYLMSVWLRPNGGELAGSTFIPIAPAPAGFEPDQVYTAEAFSTRVTELARAVPPTGHEQVTGGA
jgi:hypothetical protein